MARRPLVFTTTVFICGIILGSRFAVFPADLIILCLSMVLVPLLPERGSIYPLTVAVLAAGSLRLHMTREIIPENHIRAISIDSISSIQGTIVSAVVARDGRNQYVLELDSLDTGDHRRFQHGGSDPGIGPGPDQPPGGQGRGVPFLAAGPVQRLAPRAAPPVLF